MIKKGVLELKVYDRIPIASRLLTMPGFEAFCVEARGDGMLPCLYLYWFLYKFHLV